MKVLILTMTCGEGHNAIARTMTSCLEARGVTCKTMNIYEKRKLALAINDKGYRFLCVHMPRIYSFVWKRQRYANPEDRYKNAIQGQIKGPSKDILAELEAFCAEHKPEVAVFCVPRSGAEELSGRLVSLGIKGFWNFSHYDLSVPYPEVVVENVHLGDSLMSLGYRLRNQD